VTGTLQYHRPSSVAEAVATIRSYENLKVIAGGQSLLPAMRLRLTMPAGLVDLARIAALDGIAVSPKSVSLGAMTCHTEVAESAAVSHAIPALSSLAAGIGDRQVRNLGTVGGSLANNDPAACYPAAALALSAVVHTDRRQLGIDQFLNGMFATRLEADELITSVAFRIPARAAYVKFMHPASRFALVGVFVSHLGDEVRVAVTGAGARGAFRACSMETALNSSFSVDALVGVDVDARDLMTDMHASAEYRAHLISVLTRRAVQLAIES